MPEQGVYHPDEMAVLADKDLQDIATWYVTMGDGDWDMWAGAKPRPKDPQSEAPRQASPSSA